MSKWYRQVTADMSNIVSAISHFETEIELARLECGMKGVLREAGPRHAPPEQRSHHQEVEAHFSSFNTKMRKILSKISFVLIPRKLQLEHLSPRDADKFVDGEEDVVALQ